MSIIYKLFGQIRTFDDFVSEIEKKQIKRVDVFCEESIEGGWFGTVIMNHTSCIGLRTTRLYLELGDVENLFK